MHRIIVLTLIATLAVLVAINFQLLHIAPLEAAVVVVIGVLLLGRKTAADATPPRVEWNRHGRPPEVR